MPILAGARLGPYEILAAIGAGGMGEVYRANDSRLHRDVAIKIGAVQFSERSAREARLIAALNHPNICQIYDVGPNYLVMELVDGPTLAERLRLGPMPLDEALAIARQIGEALEAAHEKGIVHRDLKPANIKLRPDGTVKVLDFGLARVTEEASQTGSPENSPTFTFEQATLAGAIVGTAAYMAPEQARGQRVDKRADIWAFGVVLYEMLTGRRLFAGETVSDILAAVLTKEVEWSDVPPGMQGLLGRCLERDPKQRLRDIGDARFLLEDVARKPISGSRRNLPWIISAAAVTLAAVAAPLAYRQFTRQAAPPVMRLSVDLGEDAAIEPRRGASMALSPDGSRLVFVTGQPMTRSRLALRRLDQPKAGLLEGTEGAEAPFFSPDGKFIGFFADGKLKKLDVGGGAPVTLCDVPSQREGSWGDDDSIVLASTNRSGLSRVPSSGGTPQLITEPDPKRGEETHRYPQVLPGAAAVLFVNGIDSAGEGSIEAQSFKTGKRTTLVPAGAYGRFLPSGHLVYMHRGTLFAAPMDPRRLDLTGPPIPLLQDVGFHPGTGTAAFTFSQSGMFVYVAAAPDDHLRPIGLMDEKGKLELLPLAKARYSHPRVSPDGTRLAVTIDEGAAAKIWIYEWSSQRFWRLAFPNGNSERPVWAGDGRHLVFLSTTQAPGPGIYWMRADGAGAPQRLVEGPDVIPGSVSSKAGQLAYAVTKGPGVGLWRLPLDCSDTEHPKPGVAERWLDGDEAAFSPDGRWIAYTNAQSGLPEILVRPLAGSGGPWQISAGGDGPAWPPGGQALFYRSLPGFQIMVSGYSVTGDSFSPAPPRLWNDTRVEGFDVMPDGKRVVMIPAAEQKHATHATFLLNFADDLRRRVPAGK
jgi:Tol biopolymer transport system component